MRAKKTTGTLALGQDSTWTLPIRSMPNTTTWQLISQRSFPKSSQQMDFLLCVISFDDLTRIDGMDKDLTRQSIFGHSMGGHGALTLYLASRSKQYKSASAFAPIANPTKCPWGQKAFRGYLQGGVQEASSKYDATDLIAKATESIHILIDYVRHFLNV